MKETEEMLQIKEIKERWQLNAMRDPGFPDPGIQCLLALFMDIVKTISEI